MDPLAILTRGARPLKQSQKSKRLQTPSTGPSASPQLFPDSDRLNGKRKRGLENTVRAESDGVDFFASDQVQRNGPSDPAERKVVPDKDHASIPAGQMSLEQRKRTYKQHKLKVTVLDGIVTDGDWHDPGSSKGDSEEERKGHGTDKKKRPVMLYPAPMTTFDNLRAHGLSEQLLRNLADQGFRTPTEVQMVSLPLLLDNAGQPEGGEAKDLLTIAPTGSGKTLSFLIPVLHRIYNEKIRSGAPSQAIGLRAIVLAPTKELVNQIANEGRKLGAGMDIRIAAARKRTFDSLRRTAQGGGTNEEMPDVLVGTPGSLSHRPEDDDKDEITGAEVRSSATTLDLSDVHYLILDEADVLLDPLFRSQTLAVLSSLSSPELRLSLWSATVSSSIESLLVRILHDRRNQKPEIRPVALLRLVVGLKDSAVPNISHRLSYCATERGKLLALRELLVPQSTSAVAPLRAPFLVFTQTVERSVALHDELRYDIPVAAGGSSRIAVLHSGLPDRVREAVLTRFRKGEVWVLITTDMLARGVDFRGVNGVVNYDVPTSAAGYVHRVGRTGRAGREGGVAVTLYTKEDVKYVKVVANMIAAGERSRGKGEGERSVEQWLLDALPDVNKEDRKRLKLRGVEERRQGERKGRIPTKTGYKKQQRLGHKQPQRPGKADRSEKVTRAADERDDDFSGFSD